MSRCAWLWLLAAVLPLQADQPAAVPHAVAEYRARLEIPGCLAEEILLAASEKLPWERPKFDSARAEVAFYAMRSAEEIDRAIETASVAARQRAEAAVSKRNSADAEADSNARHEEAKAWAELAGLRLAAGQAKEALAADRSRLEALAPVATPEEWLGASLAVARSSHRAGDAKSAEALLSLAKKLTGKEGPLQDSSPAAARVLACQTWIAIRDNQKPFPDRLEMAIKAAEVLEKALGREAQETLDDLEEIAVISTNTRSDEQSTVALLQRLAAGRQTVFGPDHPATLNAVQRLGNYLWTAHEEADGYAQLRKAFDGWERGAGLGLDTRLQTGNRIANWQRENADYEAAERTFRKIIEAGTKARGGESRDVLWNRSNLAIVLSALGDYAGAEKLSREVGAIRARVLGPEDPDSITSLNNTAVYVRYQGRYREAAALFWAALKARVAVQGMKNREVFRAEANLAEISLALGDLPQAERLFQLTMEQRRAMLKDNTDTADSIGGAARVALIKGDLATAEQLANEALEMRERVSGAEHPSTLGAMSVAADVLTARGQHTKALEMQYRALSLREARYGVEDPGVLWTVRELGNALSEAGDFAGAETALRRVLESYEKRLGREHPQSIETAGTLGEVLGKKGDRAAAEPLLRRALERGEEMYDAEHPFVAEMANALAEVLSQAGKPGEALPLAERASAIAKKKFPENQRLRQRYDALVEKLHGQSGKTAQPATRP